MIPVKNSNITTIGSFEGEKIKMKMDADSLQWISSILINMYSDVVGACVREYATNAVDSHVQAGVKRPIEVSLPGAFSPFYKVRDFGVGLDSDGIREIYSQYGASTKRESNDTNGILGIGAKCAMALGPNFSVVGIKNGVRTVVMVSLDDGAGEMEIIDVTSTTEPNGVEISIPVKSSDVRDFHDKAATFFSYWADGTVLVDGQAPKRANLTQVSDRTFYVPRQNYWGDNGSDIVVMGGVAYPLVDEHRIRSQYGRYSVVCFVDIGAVSFAPSREALMYTKSTIATIDALRKEFHASLRTSVQKTVDEQPNHIAALNKADEIQRTLDIKGFTYKGQDFPQYVSFNYRDHMRATALSGTKNQMTPDTASTRIFVHNTPETFEFTRGLKAKFNYYMEQNHGGRSDNYIVYTDAKEGGVWVTDDRRVDFEDVVAIKVPRRQPANVGTRIVRDVVLYDSGAGMKEVSVDDLDASRPIIYEGITLHTKGLVDHYMRGQVGKHFPDAQLIFLGKNKWDKLLKAHPEAMTLEVAIRLKAATLEAAMSPDDLRSYHDHSYAYGKANGWYSKVIKANILDPALKKELTYWTTPCSDLPKAFADFITSFQSLGYHIRPKSVPVQDTYDFTKHYPLLGAAHRGDVKGDHLETYVNAIYKSTLDSTADLCDNGNSTDNISEG